MKVPIVPYRFRRLFRFSHVVVLGFVLAFLSLPAGASTQGDLLQQAGLSAPESVSIAPNTVSDDTTLQVESLRKESESVLEGFPRTSPDIGARIEALRAEAEQLASPDIPAAQWQVEPSRVVEYGEAVNRLIAYYRSYMDVDTEYWESISGGASVSADASSESEHVPPFSIAYYDESLRLFNQLKKARQDQSFFISTLIQERKVRYNTLVADQRKLDSLTQYADQIGPDGWSLKEARLKVETDQVMLAQATSQLVNGNRYRLGIERGFAEQEKQIKWIRDNVDFTDSDLKEIVSGLRATLEKKQDELAALQEKGLETSNAVSRFKARLPQGLSFGDDSKERTRLYGAASQSPEIAEYALAVLRNMDSVLQLYMARNEIDWLSDTEWFWRQRYAIFHNTLDGTALWEVRDKAQKRIDLMDKTRGYVTGFQSEIYANYELVNSQIPDAKGRTLTALQQMQRVFQALLSDIATRLPYVIETNRALAEAVAAEAKEKNDAVRVAEKVTSLSRDAVFGFFNKVLWTGEGFNVTVWKLALAIFIFIVGHFASGMMSRFINRKILTRFSHDVTSAGAMQRILFFVFWFSFILIALDMVGIPLTAFAFLGGAMVVAIGFGAQNIFNNLISGFIIMFSRPFKLGDIVTVDSTSGTIEDIDSRSTRIRTWDNIDVLIPNRYLLENKVVNSTRTDSKTRQVLSVGVDYNADSREVEKILMDIAKTHTQVLQKPAPFVVFKNFGANALEFDLYYWLDIVQSSSLVIGSDMRHHILSVFRNRGIGIPFPQMVVHTGRPDVESIQFENKKETAQDASKDSGKDAKDKKETAKESKDAPPKLP